ncbi:hypothetical protein ACW9H6_22125 [Pseudomonas sp. SDO528_S397]|jgi:hypothetical protein|uniref:hypothetical protein n=1 Tax=Pseudomonas canadensis TaxID=915099 RepID=UPI001071A5E1
MKRKDAIAHITVAGYHDDSRTAMRIYTENRISYQVYTEAYAKGAQLKSEGMVCTCFQLQATPCVCLKSAVLLPCSSVRFQRAAGVETIKPASAGLWPRLGGGHRIPRACSASPHRLS